ncbi:MAG: OmpW/AlkL family protein [Pseudomonadota bacterium]
MTSFLKTATAVAIGASLSLSATNAFAQEGDFILRVGAAHVSPNDDSSNVLGTDDGVSVDAGTSLGFSGTWMLKDNWGVEVLASLPFTHDINGTGSLDGIAIGETKHLPPTVSMQYYPNSGSDSFSPYVGLGLNYTLFFDEKADSELKTALGTNDVKLDLDDSVGLAAQVGADWKISDNLYFNAALWYIDIETDADVVVDGATATTVDVGIDPVVAMMGIARRF